jgi:hypothetical protein
MSWIVGNIRWVMIASGALTATMLYAALAPEAALQSTFGETLTGPLANIVVRTWGALIALVGAMLIYGAFAPPVRPLVLTVASVSKAFFIGLVLAEGSRYLGQAGLAVAVDAVMIVLFLWYLLAEREPSEPSEVEKWKSGKVEEVT